MRLVGERERLEGLSCRFFWFFFFRSSVLLIEFVVFVFRQYRRQLSIHPCSQRHRSRSSPSNPMWSRRKTCQVGSAEAGQRLGLVDLDDWIRHLVPPRSAGRCHRTLPSALRASSRPFLAPLDDDPTRRSPIRSRCPPRGGQYSPCPRPCQKSRLRPHEVAGFRVAWCPVEGFVNTVGEALRYLSQTLE